MPDADISHDNQAPLVRFVLTYDDYSDAYEHYWSRVAGPGTAHAVVAALIGLLIGLIAVGAGVYFKEPLTAVFGVVMSVILMFVTLNRLHALRARTRALRRGWAHLCLFPLTVDLYVKEDGFRFQRGEILQEMPWSDIRDLRMIGESPDRLLIVDDRYNDVCWVPESAFPSVLAFDGFAIGVMEKWAQPQATARGFDVILRSPDAS